MKTTREEKKTMAIAAMKKLGFFGQYIKDFEEKDIVTMFINYGGYHPNDSEQEMFDKIQELEDEYDLLVYAVIRSRTRDYELYSFLYVPDNSEEYEYMIEENGNLYYVFSYCWNKTDECCSEFGDICVKSFGGGINRVQ